MTAVGACLNTFGHDRRNLDFRLRRPISPDVHPTISYLMERAERISTNPEEFPEFHFLGKRRSERRESVVRALKILTYRMDLPSFRVGTLHADRKHVTGIPVSLLSDWTGLTFDGDNRDTRGRSGRRLERALHDLARAGYMSAKPDRAGRLRAPQPIEVDDTHPGGRRWRGLPAIRRFTPLYFKRCQATLRVELAQKNAAKKLREAADEEERERAAAAATELARLHGRPRRQPDQPDAGRAENDARRFGELAIALRLEHGDWSADEIRTEARRRMLATGPPYH